MWFVSENNTSGLPPKTHGQYTLSVGLYRVKSNGVLCSRACASRRTSGRRIRRDGGGVRCVFDRPLRRLFTRVSLAVRFTFLVRPEERTTIRIHLRETFCRVKMNNTLSVVDKENVLDKSPQVNNVRFTLTSSQSRDIFVSFAAKNRRPRHNMDDVPRTTFSSRPRLRYSRRRRRCFFLTFSPAVFNRRC